MRLSNPTVDAPGQRSQYQPRQPMSNEKKKLFKERKYFICKQPRHRAFDCPTKGSVYAVDKEIVELLVSGKENP